MGNGSEVWITLTKTESPRKLLTEKVTSIGNWNGPATTTFAGPPGSFLCSI